MNHENDKPLRPELSALIERLSLGQDENRPEAVARRRQTHLRTARANVMDLCDEGSFIEYGALAVAAQRGRRSEADLIQKTPTDGMIAGVGAVNGDLVGEDNARCMVMAYDYTVLAGTQGYFNHKKKELAAIEDEAQRKQLYDSLVAELYKRGQAMNMASYLEIDAVIDPAETRRWITRGIKSATPEAFSCKGHGFVDSW